MNFETIIIAYKKGPCGMCCVCNPPIENPGYGPGFASIVYSFVIHVHDSYSSPAPAPWVWRNVGGHARTARCYIP